MVVFAIIFGLLSALKLYAAPRHKSYTWMIPSGIAFAIGFLNTPSFSLGQFCIECLSLQPLTSSEARLIGGIIEYVFRTRYVKDESDIRIIVVARFVFPCQGRFES
jgi:hypothetical protein